MRKFASIAVAGALLVSVSACSTPGSSLACDVEGSADLVTAEGAFGADPELDFPTPLVASQTSVAEPIIGDGDPVPAGGAVMGTVTIYNGETGDPVVSGGELIAVPILFPTRDYNLPFTESLQCGSDGSRIVTTGTATDMLGAQSLEQFSLEPDVAVVVVTDIDSSFMGRADGVDQLAQEGMPAIVLAPNGQPGFTFPDSPAPTELRADLLKRGGGKAAAADDVIIVNFSAIEWGGEELLQSTWVETNGAPVALPLGAAEDLGLITAAVKEQLVGQTVGSQLLIAAPGEQTVVYVIDILGIAE